MNNLIIKVENLSKIYRLGEIGTGTLSHDLNRWWANLRGKEDPFTKVGHINNHSTKGEKGEMVWALKDINFEVKQGEVVGIIGRNGAGKSTLLKILSQVTTPTTGHIKIKGRIASLLEVGTGFHPELTGRENIFLNGAILGMTKTEIRNKFDEIVDFAGVAKYIDTPVKRYSSGMYVRLAFGVAAHLEPEILIVDEVLAVGDAEFQKKALGKMQDVSTKDGRTVLFVSHNMAAVKKLCSKGIVLEHGKAIFDGKTNEAIDFYINKGLRNSTQIVWDKDEPCNEIITLKNISLTTENDESITIDSGFCITVTFLNQKQNTNLDFTLYLVTIEDLIIFESGVILTKNNNSENGIYTVSVNIPSHLLNAGTYKLNLLWGENQRYELFRYNDAITFEISNTSTGRGSNMSIAPGVIRPILEWKHNFTHAL